MKYKIFYCVVLSLITALFISCASGEVIIDENGIVTAIGDSYRNIEVLSEPISYASIPNNRTMIMGRVVFYKNNKLKIAKDEKIQLGFIPMEKVTTVRSRANNIKFYNLEIDDNGYFFLIVDSVPLILSNIYIDDDKYTIPSTAYLNLQKEDRMVYCGELHIIKRENKQNTSHFVDTFFDFYQNTNSASQYLKNAYYIDINNIRFTNFIEPYKNIELDS